MGSESFSKKGQSTHVEVRYREGHREGGGLESVGLSARGTGGCRSKGEEEWTSKAFAVAFRGAVALPETHELGLLASGTMRWYVSVVLIHPVCGTSF